MYKSNNVLFYILTIGSIFFTSTSNAEVYIKAFAGNTITNQKSSYDTRWFDDGGAFPTNALIATTTSEFDNSPNSFTSGASIGAGADLNYTFALGLELQGYRQLEKFKYSDIIPSNLVSTGAGLINVIKSRNEYNLKLSAVLSIWNAIYIKAGPALLRENITTDVREPNLRTEHKQKDKRDFYGASGGLGFNYKLSNLVSFFAEYNYTYFGKRDLKDIILGPEVLEDTVTPVGDGDKTEILNRSFRYAQSAIFAGLKLNII